jgi:hypothetical protein
MQQLIEQITNEYDMSAEDANHIIQMVNDYNSKNVVTNTESAESTFTQTVETPQAIASASALPAAEESMFQKATHFVEDHLPGGMKEKAEEMLGGLGDKVKGLFS